MVSNATQMKSYIDNNVTAGYQTYPEDCMKDIVNIMETGSYKEF
jgi:hypothetical protein